MRVTLENTILVFTNAAGLKPADEDTSWAKWIDRVALEEKGGYCFVGDFIQKGTAELVIEKSRLILLCAGYKSDDGPIKLYRVLLINPQGQIKPTHIGTDDRVKGWAYRIRELVANLLPELDAAPVKAQPGKFAAIEVEGMDDETRRSTISRCDICKRSAATLFLYQRDDIEENVHLCGTCNALANAVIVWASSTGVRAKVPALLTYAKRLSG